MEVNKFPKQVGMDKIYYFLSGTDWELICNEIIISENIKLVNAKESKVFEAFQNYCRESGYEGGEGSDYPYYLELNMIEDVFANPYTDLAVIINIMTIILNTPHHNTMRFIPHWPNLKYSQIERGSEYPIDGNWLDYSVSNNLTDEKALEIKTAFNNFNTLVHKETGLFNSVLYFYQAWNSHFTEHVTVQLAISIESLFSPDTRSELTHQIAMNYSFFLEQDPQERFELYKHTKRFYNIRSAVVHGGSVKKLDYLVVKDIYYRQKQVLKKLLLSQDYCEIFTDKRKIKSFFESLIFDLKL